MKKIILILLLLIIGGGGGYLYYDWWRFENQPDKITQIENIYTWKDADGAIHYSNKPPENQENVTVSEGFKSTPLPIVYQIQEKASMLTDKIKDKAGKVRKEKQASKKKKDKKKKKKKRRRTKAQSITIYTSNRCKYCSMAKKYISKKGYKFTEKNVSTSFGAKSEFRRLGGKGVPLIIIDGNRINGFNRSELDMYLK